MTAEKPEPSGHSGVKFAKTSSNVVVPVGPGDGDDSAARGILQGDRSTHRTLRISAVVDVAPDDLGTPDGPSRTMSRTKSGLDTSVRGGGKQHNKLAAQLAAKSMRRSSFKSPSMKGQDFDLDELGKDENGEEIGPWGILRKDQQRQSFLNITKVRLQKLNAAMLIKPGMNWYHNWFYLCVILAVLSGWVLPFHFAFMEPGGLLAPYNDWVAIVEYIGGAVFFTDFVFKFFLAHCDAESGALVTARLKIARHYIRSQKFLMDVLGWFPIDWIVTDVAASAGASASTLRGLAWLKLLHLARLYRVFELFADLDYRMVLSQGTLLLTRNYTFVFFCTHWAACILYQIAAHQNFSANSWVGRNAARFEGRPTGEKYLLSLYFSVSAFTGLGDGGLYAGSVPEAAFMILYLLFNLFLGAYILGTVTMLVVKGDERSKQFRDRMTTLNDFSSNNEIPDKLQSAMQEHLEVTFHSEQVDDEHVLGIYPTTIRRKVLRHLYLQPVKGCYLFKGCKQRFLDALLTAARVEMFMPGVQLLNEGDNVTELNIVVSGEVLVAEAGINLAAAFQQFTDKKKSGDGSGDHSGKQSNDGSTHSAAGRTGSLIGRIVSMGSKSSMGPGMKDFSVHSQGGFLEMAKNKQVSARYSSDSLAEVPFFSDVPSNETVMSQSVVRVLSLPKSAWESLAQQFPQQARLVLTNLQNNTELELEEEIHEAAEGANMQFEQLKLALHGIRDTTGMDKVDVKLMEHAREALTQAQIDHLVRLDDIRSLVRSHVRKVDQVRTFEFLGCASEGDLETLRAMLGQGMSPNACDYDGRTGLMLAAVGGHETVVRLLLDSGAKSDQLDAFGNSAMCEAVKNSHDDVIDLLLNYGGTLAMEDMAVASTMCTAVFEGDLVKLRRLLRSGAPPDACDYDKRCALHIAGAEGNLAAVKLLVEEGGADPGFQDRWGNTALDEGRRVGAAPVVTYLEGLLKVDQLDAAGKRYRQQVASDFLAACGQGEAERVRFIVQNSQPGCVFTGLVLASSKGHKDVVEALVAWVAPELIVSDGHIALTEAARMGQPSAVSALRAAGVKLPDPRDSAMLAALRAAVQKMDIKVAAALLAAGVDAGAAASPGGGSLVHVAAGTGSLALVRRMVEEGGLSPSAEDASGRPPAAVADAAKHSAAADYLRWAAVIAASSSGGGAGTAAAALAAAAVARFGALPDLTAPPVVPADGGKTPSGGTASGAAGPEHDNDLPLLIAHMGGDTIKSGTSTNAPPSRQASGAWRRNGAPSLSRNASSLRALTRRSDADGVMLGLANLQLANAGGSNSRPTSASTRPPAPRSTSNVGYVAAAAAISSRGPTGSGFISHSNPMAYANALEAAELLAAGGGGGGAAGVAALHTMSSMAQRPMAVSLPVLVEDEGGELGSSVRSRGSAALYTVDAAPAAPATAVTAPVMTSNPSFAHISGVMPMSHGGGGGGSGGAGGAASPRVRSPLSQSPLANGSSVAAAAVAAAAAAKARPMTPLGAAAAATAAETDAAAAAVAAAAAATAGNGSRRTTATMPKGPDDLETFLSSSDLAALRPSQVGMHGASTPKPTAGATGSSLQPQLSRLARSNTEDELTALSPPGV